MRDHQSKREYVDFLLCVFRNIPHYPTDHIQTSGIVLVQDQNLFRV